MSDQELLREFWERRSESAFRLLTQKHVDLVYATALRRLSDPGLAEETTQEVFIALARQAPRLSRDINLAGWLYKATLLESCRRYRDEQRRQRRDELAVQLSATMKDQDSLLQALAPELDDALMHLPEKDRQALLLRFFEKKSFREVAVELGIGEDAAQKRVAKSLDLLTAWFRRRGYAVPASATVAAALGGAAKAAPSGLAALAAKAALSAASTASLSGLGLWLAKLMMLTKTQTAVVCLALLGAPAVYQWRAFAHERVNQQQYQADLSEVQRALAGETQYQAQLENRLRNAQAQETNLQARWQKIQNGEVDTAEAGLTIYPWDEQSDYVRLPKSLASRLTFAEFHESPVPKSKPRREQNPVLERDGTPSSALASALGFSVEESQAVTELSRKTFADFAALAAQHGRWAKENYSMTGGVEYKTWHTPALPEEGGQLRQAYEQSLGQILGEERAQAYLQQSRKVIREVVNDFGKVPYAVTVARQKEGQVIVGEMFFGLDGTGRDNRAVYIDEYASDIAMNVVPGVLKPTFDEWMKTNPTRKP